MIQLESIGQNLQQCSSSDCHESFTSLTFRKQTNGDLYLWAQIRNASNMEVETTELDDQMFLCIYSMRGGNVTTCAMTLIQQHSPLPRKWKPPPGQNPSIRNIAGTYQMDATFWVNVK